MTFKDLSTPHPKKKGTTLTQTHRLPKKRLAAVVFCCAFVLLNLVIKLQSLTLKIRTAQACSSSKKRLHLYSSVKHFTVSHISVE